MNDPGPPSRNLPRSVGFRRERESDWLELEDLIGTAKTKGLQALSPEGLERLPVLYRGALSSLSVARRTAMDRELVRYLNSLAVRAYLTVYTAPAASRSPLRMVLGSFPTAVARIRWELLIATAFFVAGSAIGAALTLADPSWYYTFVSEDMAAGRTPDATTESLREALYGGSRHGLATFASFLFTHNARIGMAAFATGFAAGIPSAMLLFVNGLTLGAFVALYAQRGLFVPVMGWLLPHGVPEIFAVLLCGAAGMHLGRAIVLPGRDTVREALTRRGRTASRVMMGAILLFAVAGLFEGFFRQLVQNNALRYVIAALQVLWITAWLALARNKEESI